MTRHILGLLSLAAAAGVGSSQTQNVPPKRRRRAATTTAGTGSRSRGRRPPALFASSPPSIIPPPPPLSVPVWSLAAPLVDSTFDDDDDDIALDGSQDGQSLPPLETRTAMNIVTFATPVSVAPPKLWIVSLYSNTLTRRAFVDAKVGVLQLLTTEQSGLVEVLGKRSGYEDGYSKREACSALEEGDDDNGRGGGRFAWVPAVQKDGDALTSSSSSSSEPLISRDDGSSAATLDLLPGCASYMKLKLLTVTEAGDHDAALCQVTGIGTWDADARCVVAVAADDAAARPVARDADTVLYTGRLREEGII